MDNKRKPEDMRVTTALKQSAVEAALHALCIQDYKTNAPVMQIAVVLLRSLCNNSKMTQQVMQGEGGQDGETLIENVRGLHPDKDDLKNACDDMLDLLHRGGFSSQSRS